MSEWMKSMAGYLLIVSLTMQILPNKKYEQYVKLFSGALLLILFLQPILKIGSADLFLERKIAGFVQTQEQLEKMIGKEVDLFRKEVEVLQENESLKQDLFEMIEIPRIEQMEVKIED